jgi:signal transduction histidine kinase
MGWPRRVAIATCVLTVALLAVAVVFTALAPTTRALVNLIIGLAVAPVAVVLGVIITRRQPANLVGALLALVGLTAAVTVAKETGWVFLAGRPDVLASVDWLVAVLNDSAAWIFVAVALLLLYFPDGRLPGRRWRWVPPALVVATAVGHAYEAFDTGPFRPPLPDLTHPFGPPPAWLEIIGLPAFVLFLGLVLACAASLVVRFRRADRVGRARIKWLALAGFGIPLYPLLCLVEIAIWGRPVWFSAAVGIAALVGIPVATAVAVLRHDLYDVDKALAAAVTYGLLTGALLSTYALVSFTGGLVLGRESTAVAAGATALCALALAPLRHRLQRAVDRRLYPLRRAALAAIENLHRQIHTGQAQPEQLEPVLRTALRDPELRVGFQLPGTDGLVDATGASVDRADGAEMVLGGVSIGVIRHGVGVASPELLRQVAGAAATLAEVVRLRLELAGALHEVESSRARLVQIGYEERRRLERDLHDGAQQRLVSLGMALRLAQRHLGDGTVDVDGLLDQSVAELGTAVAELRQIAYGLRPSRLDDGLDAALAALLRTVPVEVNLDVGTGSLPDDVATTAYYVASEAVTNAVKHATASHIGLEVARADGQLMVRVSDDGKGGARLSTSSGLVDRVAALGGTLRVDSPVGRGTVVEVTLPCGS